MEERDGNSDWLDTYLAPQHTNGNGNGNGHAAPPPEPAAEEPEIPEWVAPAPGAPAAGIDPHLPVDRPWRVVSNYGHHHGTWKRITRRGDGGDIVEMVRQLDDAITLRSVLVVDGLEVALELRVAPPLQGRERDVVVPISVVAANSPAQELINHDLIYTPAEAKKVQEYLAYLVKNSADEMRADAYERPCWYEGRLMIPGAEYQEGDEMTFVGDRRVKPYGEHCFTDEEGKEYAAECVAGMYASAMEHSKFGLLLGASVISPYLAHLGSKGFIVHPCGDSTKGKTQSARCAMSVWGCPKSFENDWNTTSLGASKLISLHGIVPVMMDDTGSATQKNVDSLVKELVFRVSSGQGRTRATVTGGLAEEDPETLLVVISTGERRLTDSIVETGARARVLELPAPIFPTAEAADSTYRLAEGGHGWVAQKLVDWGEDGAYKASHLLSLIEDQVKDSVDGDVEKRLSKVVSACGVGLAMVGLLIGLTEDEVIDDILRVCKSGIHEATQVMKEEGTTVADRLAHQINQAVFSHPMNWAIIGKEAYSGEAETDKNLQYLSENAPREIWGGKNLKDNTLCILKGAMKDIAAKIGIEDVVPALQSLLSEGVLVGGNDDKHPMMKQRTLVDPATGKSSKLWFYVISMDALQKRVGVDDDG